MKALTKKLVFIPIAAFLVVLAIVVAIMAAKFTNEITLFLCPPTIDKDATAAAQAEGETLAEKILAEGAVLVRNENNLLPLSKTEVPKVNFFGWGSSPNGWVVGGSGSGRVQSNVNDGSNAPYADTPITTAFEKYGIENNSELTSMYTDFRNDRPAIGNGTLNTSYANLSDFYRLVEPRIEDYSADLKSNAEAFSNTAFVVLSRIAGEAKDAPRWQALQTKKGTSLEKTDNTRHYLEISEVEEDLLDYVCDKFENVIVIINSTNVMELGFLEDYDVDACLIVGGSGINAATAIPKLIYGDINPSGRLADTYAYDFETNINYNYAGFDGEGMYVATQGSNTADGSLLLANSQHNGGPSERHGTSYVDYIEDIYMGYKWYETADAEGVWADFNTDYGKGYEGVVQYPFGYGLGYNAKDDYSWDIIEIKNQNGDNVAPGATLNKNDEITISVNVTNNGTVAGHDVVEAYVSAPYTNGEIEKPSVSLVAFGKTLDVGSADDSAEDEDSEETTSMGLPAGESQVVTLKFKVEDLASYDAYDKNNNGFKGWELDEGTYEIRLMTDAHNVKSSATYIGTEINGVLQFHIPAIKYETDSITGATVQNMFTGDDALDGCSIDGKDENGGDGIEYISRANFPTPEPGTLDANKTRVLSDKARALNSYTEAMANEWDNATEDIFGNPVNVDPVPNKGAIPQADMKMTENQGNKATDLGLTLGADFDAEKWNDFINQVSISDMKSFAVGSSLTTSANNTIGLPAINNLDGPNQISGFSSFSTRTVGYPNATVTAQTFNVQLALQFGTALCTEGVSKGVRGWLGPAINMHRTPFGGRNYEYYSEDPLLTGMMASYAIIGGNNAGAYCYLKHIVLYEQESNREALYTWLTEQNLRETYLKPFKIAVQSAVVDDDGNHVGGVKGIMSSYNRIGAVWTGGSESLITGVLRNEWGFKGAVITDWSDNKEYMNFDQALRAGSNRNMGSSGWLYGNATSSDRFENRVRDAYKETMYMITSAYYQNANPVSATEQVTTGSTTPSFRWWIILIVVFEVLLVGGAGVLVFFSFKKGKAKAEKVSDEEKSEDKQE